MSFSGRPGRGPGPRGGSGFGRSALRWEKKNLAGDSARAWYHCTACGHGFEPRDAQLGIAGQSMSERLRKMTARAAAVVPFAAAVRLVAELAGLTLTGKREGRRAEADGQAAAAVIEARAAAVQARALVPLPPARSLTCCMSRSTGPGLW